MSLREKIINRAIIIKPVEAFGETLYVKEMTGEESSSFEKWLTQNTDRSGTQISCELLARTLCDAEGNRLFSDDDAKALAKLPSPEIRRAYNAAESLNKIDEDDIEAAEGNSEGTESSTPSSLSLVNSE